MGPVMIIGGLAAMVLGLLVYIWAARSQPADLRGRMDRAGLKACRIEGHPRRMDMAHVLCPTETVAARACAFLADDPQVAEATVLDGDRTVEVLFA